MLSMYHQGSSVLHRMPARAKLALLAAAGTALFFVDSAPVLAAVAVAVLGGYALAGVPAGRIGRLLLGLAPVALALFIAQWWLREWQSALVVTARLVALILLADLVSRTTRSNDIVAVVEWLLSPLRRVGVRPERVGLAVALTIRFVPVIREQSEAVLAAHRARGVHRSLSFLVPILIRTLRMADGLGEAMEARGVD